MQISDIKYICYLLKGKCVSIDLKLGVGKIKITAYHVFSSSYAHSIRGLELGHPNSIKELNPYLFMSNLGALALNLSKHLKIN